VPQSWQQNASAPAQSSDPTATNTQGDADGLAFALLSDGVKELALEKKTKTDGLYDSRLFFKKANKLTL
jgi:hypothetical protein